MLAEEGFLRKPLSFYASLSDTLRIFDIRHTAPLFHG